MRTAIVLLSLLAVYGASAADSPSHLLQANQDLFTAFTSLVARAGLEGTFKDGSLSHTYFLPSDHSFGWFKDYLESGESTTMEDVLKAIQAATPEQAKAFVEAHIVHQAIPTVDDLMDPTNEYVSAVNVPISGSGEDIYVAVNDAEGNSGTIAGPVVIPAGKSFVYVINDGLLADPSVVVGHGPLHEDVPEEEFDVIFEEPAAAAAATGQEGKVAAPPAAEDEGNKQEL